MICALSELPDHILQYFLEMGDPVSYWIAGVLTEERSMGGDFPTWVYCKEENPLVLFSQMGNTFTFSEIPSDIPINYGEIAGFIRAIPGEQGEIWGIGGKNQAVRQIWSILKHNGFYLQNEKSGKTMEYLSRGNPEIFGNVQFQTTETLDYEQLYQLLLAAQMSSVVDSDSKDAWHTTLSYNLRHGFVKVGIIEKNGEYLAVGMLEENVDGIAFLSSITTNSLHRKKGLGTQIVNTLTNEALKDQRRPFLFALGEEAEKLYASLGFEEIGEWCDIHHTMKKER